MCLLPVHLASSEDKIDSNKCLGLYPICWLSIIMSETFQSEFLQEKVPPVLLAFSFCGHIPEKKGEIVFPREEHLSWFSKY